MDRSGSQSRPAGEPVNKPPAGRFARFLARILLLNTIVVVLLLLGGLALLVLELRSNANQGRLLAEFASSITFRMASGPDPGELPPDRGPYDVRLGYAQGPAIQLGMEDAGYSVAQQGRLSRRHEELVKRGIFYIYQEKAQAGLELLGHNGEVLHRSRYPQQIYTSFEDIPELVLQPMSFIEDRELLDFSHPYRNPVIDWERLARAVALQALKSAGLSDRSIGASTVATQLEKLRHSPGGITHDAGEKLQQMVSAVLRVYRGGADTIEARKNLALGYLNSLPLAARRGFGEVNGLADGLRVWYGSDFAQVNTVLADDSAPLALRALYFKQVLSLVLAIRRPAYYLADNRDPLDELTNSYLRIMLAEHFIPAELGAAALQQTLQRNPSPVAPRTIDFRDLKGVNLLRTRLLPLLQSDNFYQLDRLDVTARSTLDAALQAQVTDFLAGLASRERIAELGLTGERLMSASDPAKVIYSFTLYEADDRGNHLRVNADNLDKPFDVNAGAKLDLGSTAKLRTLITWLDLVAGSFERLAALQASGDSEDIHPRDRLSAWVWQYLQQHPGADQEAVLRAAMARTFSASPATSFYTGGGVHTFANFERADNQRSMTVSEALRRSVNLVFIRVMKEVVDHYMYRAPDSLARVLENPQDPGRMDYLRRFADREGTQYLSRFYRKYAGQPRQAALETLFDGVRVSPRSLTVILRSLSEVASAEELAPWLARYTPDEDLTASQVEKLFDKYDPVEWDLNDRGYLARIHPLELWLLDYLAVNPGATLADAVADSAQARQEVYRWLMKTSRRRAQDRRILDLLEIEAFQQIHQSWRELGYPFASLTPSLATSIGSSGDRPAALAELMGILVANGQRRDTVLFESIDFAADTPYETRFSWQPSPAVQVLRPAVARVVKEGLVDVVENGTARALLPALKSGDGSRHVAGGKTGTGDHRYEVYAGPGRLVESRVVNRVATFVFQIDERFFGTITAFVPGAEAENYRFTSGLPVRLLAALMPTLSPLIDRPPGAAQACTPGSDSPGCEHPGG
ncbi:MAG: transglycosylase domain-containing protein [Halieaceae bacterium]|nr:transglycosylase domain-containing protein [Halieaceae bacterium]MCP5164840.1 transglycosylase domain-containing protein [Pseudomonadales bacterium]MCP5202754.1 transglycosylase domain-containing protein [Pseudomonadales bacterium]